MRNIFLIGLLACVVLASCDSSKSVQSSSAMETRTDSMYYAMGVDLANNFKRSEIEVNPEAVLMGMQSVLGEQESALAEEDQRKMMGLLQQMIIQKQREAQMAQQQNQQPAGGGKFSTGQKAPDFKLATPEGAEMSLTDFRGKYVLVDFWASWCKPCRMENPNVVRVYNEYKSKGFEILGVSLDRSKDAWVKAIAQDKLTWKHVSDLKFWQSEAAQLYGVSAIPYTVLVDPEGTIIAQNLRGASLERKLAELLGS